MLLQPIEILGFWSILAIKKVALVVAKRDRCQAAGNKGSRKL